MVQEDETREIRCSGRQTQIDRQWSDREEQRRADRKRGKRGGDKRRERWGIVFVVYGVSLSSGVREREGEGVGVYCSKLGWDSSDKRFSEHRQRLVSLLFSVSRSLTRLLS